MNMTVPMIGTPQGWEWILIFLVILLLFGAAKLPDLARGTGRALRIFKAETKGLRDDDTDVSDEEPYEQRPRGLTAGGERDAASQQQSDDAAKRTHDS